jgi:proline racemase
MTEFLTNWDFPNDWMRIKTIDMHTGGEPLRIFVDGLPEIKGNSILEKRRYFKDNYDFIRTCTMFEPRGHADMYGAIITPPTTEGSDFGTFFMHNEGYSTMCGHAIIALTKFAFETGLVKKAEGEAELVIDTPPGKIRSRAFIQNGLVEKVSFLNVPSFLYLHDQEVEVVGIGKIKFDVAFGGAFYAFCDAGELGVELNGASYNKLIDYGKRIKKAVMAGFEIKHPFEPDLSFLYGTIFTGHAYNEQNHSRNVCIFAEGEVDRSATGSGVSARAALHFAKNELPANKKITIESILSSTMDVEIKEITSYGGFDAVVPEVSGSAHFTGKNEFCFDPTDPFRKGFIFR